MKCYDKNDRKVKPNKWTFVLVASAIYAAFVAFCFWQGMI